MSTNECEKCGSVFVSETQSFTPIGRDKIYVKKKYPKGYQFIQHIFKIPHLLIKIVKNHGDD